MHDLFKIIQNYVNNKIKLVKAFGVLTMCFYRLCQYETQQKIKVLCN